MQNDNELEQVSLFFDLFNKETERGAALLAASILDDWLLEILKTFLIDSKASIDLLEGFNAPLGSFSARTKAAYALGLLEKQEYDEINIFRIIRNHFAHKWQELSFESPSIIKECQKLDWLGPHDLDMEKDNRMKFNFAIGYLLMDLMPRKNQVLKEKRKFREWRNESRSSE